MGRGRMVAGRRNTSAPAVAPPTFPALASAPVTQPAVVAPQAAPSSEEHVGEAARTSQDPVFGHDFSRISVFPPRLAQPPAGPPEDPIKPASPSASDPLARAAAEAPFADAATSASPLPPSPSAYGHHFSQISVLAPRSEDAARSDDPAAAVDHALQGGSGQSLDAGARAFLEPRLGHDFSQVRVHTDARASQSAESVNALAYTVGSDVVFRSGQYAPGTSAGRKLLAHELTHVVQQTGGAALHRRQPISQSQQTPAVQRREYPNGQEITAPTDWTTADREQNTQRWQNANLHNLTVGDSSQYRQVIERRDFYRWFYEYTAARGYATRWALAAYIVANGAYELSHMPLIEGTATTFGAVNNELQGVMREGNQVIFDNVFPKLRQLVQGGVIADPTAALQWDMRILSEEQALIQPFYARMSPEAFSRLESAARMGWMARQGARRWGPNANEVVAGPHNRGGTVPGFSGSDLRSVDERWHYGMTLGDQFSPQGTGYTPGRDRRPQPGAEYRDGTALAQVDTRPHLHQLDAELDFIGSQGRGGHPGTMNPARVQSLLFQLTAAEQRELLRDDSPDGGTYSSRLVRAIEMGLSLNEVVRFVVGLRVSLLTQMQFLDRIMDSPPRTWRVLDYSQIQPMIQHFRSQGNQLNARHWRDVFIGVCDDDTIVTAVTDLGLDAATRQQWINEERRWF